jgi:hypothetical protein
MKFPQSIVVASMLVATACGAPKTNQAHLMAQGLGDPGVVILHGSEADQFTEALASAGVPRRLGDMNMSFVVATKLDCTVSGASAGNPVCTITQFDGSTISALASESSTLLGILSAHGAQKGSAHSGTVSATVSDIRCVNNLSGARGFGTCTFQI